MVFVRGCTLTTKAPQGKILNLFHRLRQWARTLKRDVVALYLAVRDPRVPWYAKVVAACVAAYALSPIDLIPDFIPDHHLDNLGGVYDCVGCQICFIAIAETCVTGFKTGDW